MTMQKWIRMWFEDIREALYICYLRLWWAFQPPQEKRRRLEAYRHMEAKKMLDLWRDLRESQTQLEIELDKFKKAAEEK